MMTKTKKGRLISLEGIDGCGKSTQAMILEKHLAGLLGGDRVIRTHEPGGWSGGCVVRDLLLRSKEMSPMGELFLFAADRCEHVREIIAPTLSAGRWVVCERFVDSTVAYQVYGRGIPGEYVQSIELWAKYPEPDLTLYFDIAPDVAAVRRRNRIAEDRFESERQSYLERVRDGYLELHRRYP